MGFWVFLGVVWLISPIVLVPMLVHYVKKSSALEKENRRLFNGTRFEAGNNVCVPLEEEVKAQPVFTSTALESQPISFLAGPETVKKVSKPEAEPVSLMETGYVSAPKKENKGTVFFGIGVFFVLLAGLIFATTTWSILSSAGKIMTLLSAVVVFFLCSFIAKEKLNIRETGITFYFLGSCFLSVINISVAYFGWISDAYSFKGDMGFLVLAVSLIILTVCMVIGSKIFDVPVLSKAAVVLSVFDVFFLALSCTKSMGLIGVILGAYLWLLFGILYYLEYDKEVVALKAMPALAVFFQVFSIFAFIEGDFVFVIPIFVLTVTMFIPHMYLVKDTREGCIALFDAAIMLYSILILFRTRSEYDVSIIAIFVITSLLLDLAFKNISLPKIGKIRSSLSDWCKFVFLGVSYVMVFVDELSVEVKISQPSHMIHLYVVLLLCAGTTIAEILKNKEKSSRERTLLFIEVCLAFIIAGWADFECCPQGNLVALGLIVGFYFVVSFLLKGEKENGAGLVLSIAALAKGLSTMLLLLIMDEPEWEMALEVVLLCALYFLMDLNRYSVIGFIPTLMIDFTAIRIIESFDMQTHENIRYSVICLCVMAVCIAIGRIRYRRLVDRREGHEGIDWIGACSVIFAIAALSYYREIGLLALALYLFSYYRRTGKVCWLSVASIAPIILGCLVCVQSVVKIPAVIQTEYVVLALIAVLVMEGFVWKEYMKGFSLVSSAALLVIMSFYASMLIIPLRFKEVPNIADSIGRLAFFTGISVAVALTGYFLKNTVFVVFSGVLLIESSIIGGNIGSIIAEIVVLAVGVLYGVFLWLGKKKFWICLPILQTYVFLMALEGVKPYIWAAVFLVFVGAGLGLYRRIFSKKEEIIEVDWFTLLSIIPIYVIFDSYTHKWGFCGGMMLVLYILSMYSRFEREILNKLVFTCSSVAFSITMICQPFFNISKAWNTEWILFWSWAAVIFNCLVVYKQYKEKAKYLFVFVAAVVSILWQGLEAMNTGRALDAIILSVCMAALLVYSFYQKKSSWFLLSFVTLVVQGIYASRKFWLSIAWWVYILVVGVIFIAIAAKNEYNRRNNKVKEKFAPLKDWNVW